MMEGESIEGNYLAANMPELNKSTNAAQKVHSEHNNKEVAKPELESQEDLNVGQSQKAHSENKNKVAKPELESQEDLDVGQSQKAHSENKNKVIAKPELESQEDLDGGQSQKAHSENKNKEVDKPELESQEDIFWDFGLENVSYFEIKPYQELYPSDILYGNDSD